MQPGRPRLWAGNDVGKAAVVRPENRRSPPAPCWGPIT